MSGSQSISDAAIIERFSSLPHEDRAACRTNPFALSEDSGELITADEVLARQPASCPGRFLCPKCGGQLRFCENSRGTPFFSHACARSVCPAGFETPSHLCIKRGLHAIGFECEHRDVDTGFVFDAYHAETDTAAEVVSSGTDRYLEKISSLQAGGRKCWWIVDSGSRSLASPFGTERLCLRSIEVDGSVVVSGLFRPKAIPLLSSVAEDSLFAFYCGLVWASCGNDRWRLLAEQHPLSKAATADDGMKCLMVKMHIANAFAVTELKRREIHRKTWFDRKFSYRGKFSTTWSGDRDYVVELVRSLVKDAKTVERFVSLRSASPARGVPSPPVHKSAEALLGKLTSRHEASLDEVVKLRRIAESSTVTKALTALEIATAAPAPFSVSASEIELPRKRTIRSSPWQHATPLRVATDGTAHDANIALQQAGVSKVPCACRCGCTVLVARKLSKICWMVCRDCANPVGNSWIEGKGATDGRPA